MRVFLTYLYIDVLFIQTFVRLSVKILMYGLFFSFVLVILVI